MDKIICSVIIPAYNAGKSIIRCLDSFKLNRKNYNDSLEIIVIDDGSTDNTQAIVEAYFDNLSNCQIIKKENGGVSAARNVGISAAKGKYIYFCDSDDTVIRNTLNQMITTAEVNNCDLVIAPYVHNNDKDNLKGINNFDLYCLLDREYIIKNVLSLFVSENGPASLWNKLYKKDVISKNNILFDLNRSHGEDWAFNIDYLSAASNMYVIDKAVYIYSQDGTQGSFEKYGKNIGSGLIDGQKRILELNDKYHFFEKNSIEIKNANKRFICLGIGYLELNSVSAKEKLKFLNDKSVKDALNVLYKLKPGELPSWTRKNKLAILLLKIKFYKLLMFLHYALKINMIPAISTTPT